MLILKTKIIIFIKILDLAQSKLYFYMINNPYYRSFVERFTYFIGFIEVTDFIVLLRI